MYCQTVSQKAADTAKPGSLGTVAGGIDSSELAAVLGRIAVDDFGAAEALVSAGRLRQAIYLYAQALEKAMKARILTRLNPESKEVYELLRVHSPKPLFAILVDAMGLGNTRKGQSLLEDFEEIESGLLFFDRIQSHSRYPFRTKRAFAFVEYDVGDVERVKSHMRRIIDICDSAEALSDLQVAAS